MNARSLLRHAWMDLLSAAGFLAVFLFRERFEPETLSALLLWPVLFEMMLVIALALGTMGNGLQRAVARNLWFACVVAVFVGLAWWGTRSNGHAWLWLAAPWLLLARVKPPGTMSALGNEHRQWLFNEGVGYAVSIWVVAFFAYMLLIVTVSGDCSFDASGDRVCKTPAWIFAVVWVPYFVIEALVRAWRISRLPASRNASGSR